MRLIRFVILCMSTAVLGACESDEVTSPGIPPLADVRYVNAVADTGALDLMMVDQVEFSARRRDLGFRAGSLYYPVEAGVRHIRVFPASNDINLGTQIIHDAQITLLADTRYTLLLTGSARAGTVRLWVIDDTSQPPPGGQIGVRMVNGGGAVSDGYVVNTATTALPGTATFTSVGAGTTSPYINRPTGAAAVRVTDAGQGSVAASAAGPNAPTQLPGTFPAAGVNSQGSVFSVYYFPAGVGVNSTVTAPSLIWFVDRNPCDDPPVAGCVITP
jgi:hypothetical protein